MLAALSVFSGARLADVEAVIGSLPGLEHVDVVETTASLLDKSLIQPATLRSGPPRFVMLETIKAYAEELLADSPERAESARRMDAEHYTRLAGEWRGRFGLSNAPRPTALGDEHQNLRAAWTFWVDTGDVAMMNDLLGCCGATTTPAAPIARPSAPARTCSGCWPCSRPPPSGCATRSRCRRAWRGR